MLENVEKFLYSNKSLHIASSSYNNPNLSECSYVSEGTTIIVAGEQNSSLIEQIRFNPKVEIIVTDGETTLKYNGRAKIVSDYPNQDKIIGDLAKKDNLERKGIFGVDLVQIVPTEIVVAKWDYFQEFKENKPSILKDFFHSIKKTIQIWVKGIRLPFISVSVAAVVVGTAVAYYESKAFDWVYFLLAVIGISAFHACADLLNDFFDHLSRNDEVNEKLTPFSGGSRMIQNKLFSTTRTLLGAIITFLITLGIGLYINFTLNGNIVLYIGLGGAFLGIFYVGKPIKLANFGFAEIAIFLSFGPAIVFGSYYIQQEKFSWNPIYLSIIVGLLISLVLFVNQFPDYEADKESGRRNIVVLVGRKISSIIFIIFLSLTYAILIILVILQILPYLSLITLASLLFSVRAMITTRKYHDNYLAMIPAQAMTILTTLAFTLLLAVSLFITAAIW
ncbi:MAG: UbiA family prenyltransferase [Candidatus Heimdallarchaeota archaeon]|nr:UbiA family prenyltransferase [Candidatus Heimdallarchaeota archaeon]